MLTSRRLAVALGALALALSALLWQPGPEQAAANHESAPAGQYWTSGAASVQSTYDFRHVNVWTKDCDGVRCPHGDHETSYTQCQLRAASPETVRSDGCGHTGTDGWTWDGHGCIPNTNPQECNGDNLGNAIHTCAAGGTTRTVSDPAHCGVWAACADGQVPNADRSSCVPCPSGQVPTADSSGCVVDLSCPDDDDHRHAPGGGHAGCAASHDPPVCIEGLPNNGLGEWAGPGHAGAEADGHAAVTGIPGCDCPAAGQHRHGAGVADGHGCAAAHSAPGCWPGRLNTYSPDWSPGHAAGTAGHETVAGIPGCDSGPPTEPPACALGTHRHDGGHGCEPAHTPPVCWPGKDNTYSADWSPGHAGGADDGHAAVTGIPGCVPPVPPAACDPGTHRHAAAVPGGHTGCRAVHTAPPCTWSTSLTWSPGHGGSAADGHAAVTGMTRCVSTRTYCADVGGGAFAQTVDRQRGVDAPDSRGVLAAGYHADRIPYGAANLAHAQFLPGLTVNGVASPGSIELRAGDWASVSGSTRAPASGSLAAEHYDYGPPARWRNCGQVSWARASLAVTVTGGLELAAGRVRFPAGQPCPDRGGAVTVTAAWRVSFNATAGAAYDVTETNTTRSRWPVACRSTSTAVAGVCDTVTGAEMAAAAAEGWQGGAPPVELANRDANIRGGSPDTQPPALIADTGSAKWLGPPAGRSSWRLDGDDTAAVLARSTFTNRYSWSRILRAYAVNRYDRTATFCGEVAFRLKTLTWTADPAGAVNRRPLAAGSPSAGTVTEWTGGLGVTYPVTRYEMGAGSSPAPFACAAAWPAVAGGGWEPWADSMRNAMTGDQQRALTGSVSPCTGPAFWQPSPPGRSCAGGGGAAVDVGLSLIAVWETGALAAGKYNEGGAYEPGTRWERIPGGDVTVTVPAAVFAYPRLDCPVLGF